VAATTASSAARIVHNANVEAAEVADVAARANERERAAWAVGNWVRQQGESSTILINTFPA
jgi:hypothetical protein